MSSFFALKQQHTEFFQLFGKPPRQAMLGIKSKSTVGITQRPAVHYWKGAEKAGVVAYESLQIYQELSFYQIYQVLTSSSGERVNRLYTFLRSDYFQSSN